MKDSRFFEKALGLEKPLRVKEVKMDLMAKTVDVEINLENDVHGLHRRVGEAGFHEGKNSIPVGFEGLGELAERLQAGTVSPGAPPLSPSSSLMESMS